jgi:prolyl-tRNA editing enzyme YbaK/EbsC (Cys-tRNA(Pro) deacylase)
LPGPRTERGDNGAMSLQSVRSFLAVHAPDIEILQTTTSTATVALAAAAHGVAPAQIEDRFAAKAKMLDAVEVEAATGHPVGGVCPFGLPRPLKIFADVSLRAFDVVVPAAGDTHAALRITPERLAALAGAEWIDVAQR